MKIYLAGPLFTTAERDFNAQLAALLRKNHEVCLPQEAEQEGMTPKEVFDEDVNGLDQAQVIVANMDGPDPDSGTCWECGYAYAMKKLGKKKWIILFRTDFRAMFEIGQDPWSRCPSGRD
jgi:nucleoside 2-deoxyribosyltransferase